MTPETIAGIIGIIMLVYVCIGFLFSLVFLTIGIKKIDEAAQDGTWGFRLILLPGVIVLWPVLLRKWINSGKGI